MIKEYPSTPLTSRLVTGNAERYGANFERVQDFDILINTEHNVVMSFTANHPSVIDSDGDTGEQVISDNTDGWHIFNALCKKVRPFGINLTSSVSSDIPILPLLLLDLCICKSGALSYVIFCSIEGWTQLANISQRNNWIARQHSTR